MNKYKAIRTEIDGITFHSKREAKRWQELKLLERAGEIRDIKLQPSFPIVIENIKCCNVILDFSYFDCKAKKIIWEDVKGKDTQMSRLKRKLLAAQYGIEVLLT